MDSEGKIIAVMLGTEFSDYDRRTGDNKTRFKNRFTRKVGPLPVLFTPLTRDHE